MQNFDWPIHLELIIITSKDVFKTFREKNKKKQKKGNKQQKQQQTM